MKIAIIENNKISNIIVAESIETASSVIGVDSSYMIDADTNPCKIGQSVSNGLPVPEDQTPADPVQPDVTVSPVEFLLLFTSPERVLIKSIRNTDPVVSDFMDIVEHPKLTLVNLSLASTQQAVDYLLSKLVEASVLTTEEAAERRTAVLSGVFQ